MRQDDYTAQVALVLPESGTVAWDSPSNIALVKYWGKKPVQLPANASISFTLKILFFRIDVDNGIPACITTTINNHVLCTHR